MNTVKSRFGLRAAFSVLIVLTFIFSALALTVSAADEKAASVTTAGVATEYATLDEAVAALNDGDTLTLLDDATVSPITIAKEITLDLNGNTLTAATKEDTTVIIANAKVTIVDGSENKKGMINGTLTIGDTGALDINGGSFKKGLDFGTTLVSAVISPDLCVKISGVPTAVAADATKLEGNIQVTEHTYEYVAETDSHYEVCKCEYVKPDSTVAHTGGTATCIALKACEVCGASYGELADHNFAYTADSNYHFEECTVCELEKNHEKHFGGSATCSAQAVCEAANCGHGYGATLAHTPAGDLIDGNESSHWQICSVCNGIANVPSHIYPADWTVITEPTHDTEGLRERTCACGHKITKATPVLDPAEFPAWAIVLIVILCVLVLAVGVFALIWFVVKKKSFADLKAVFSKKNA